MKTKKDWPKAESIAYLGECTATILDLILRTSRNRGVDDIYQAVLNLTA